MAKNKKVISFTLDAEVIQLVDMFTEKYGFNRSTALNFILKNVLSKSGSGSMVDDMVCDMHGIKCERFEREERTII